MNIYGTESQLVNMFDGFLFDDNWPMRVQKSFYFKKPLSFTEEVAGIYPDVYNYLPYFDTNMFKSVY